MIADVINQTICTAHKHLFKEVNLLRYGVDCELGLWKPYLKSYLLQSVYDSSCTEAYSILCEIDKLSINLVTEKVCASATTFTALDCSGTITLDSTVAVEPCREGTIVLINT
jgi:hypothetical protein